MDIVCVDNNHQETCLTLSKIYYDVTISEDNKYSIVVDDYGVPNQYYTLDRFIHTY